MAFLRSMLVLAATCQVLIQAAALDARHDCWNTKTVTCTETITKTKPPNTVTKTKTETSTTCQTTSTPPTKPTPGPNGGCVLVNPLCQASGFSVAYYANPFIGYSAAQSGKDGNYYIDLKQQPLGTGTTQVTYFEQDQGPTPGALPTIYPNASFPDFPYYPGYTRTLSGGITVDANNFTLVYSGFYKAPTSGNFTLCTDADNLSSVYFGSTAGFSCAGKASSGSPPTQIGSAVGGDYMNPTSCFVETLTAGIYYPIRVVMGDYQGPSAFGFSITLPGGTASVDFTGTVYPPSCGLGL